MFIIWRFRNQVSRGLTRQREVSQKQLSASLKQLAQVRKVLASSTRPAKSKAGAQRLPASRSARLGSTTAASAFPRLLKEHEADALINGAVILN